MDSLNGLLYPLHAFLNVFERIKRAYSNITFAAFAEARSRRTDNPGFFKQLVEKRP